MVKQIKFYIDEEGEVTVSVDGVQGSGCEALTEPFESALGAISNRKYKDSFYQQTTETQNETASQGEDHG